MTTPDRTNEATAREKFEAKRRAARKKYFTPPARVRPWRTLGGLSYASASDLTSHKATPLDPADQSPLAVAIRAQWPKAKPAYQGRILQRYREFYKAIPEHDAVKAVRAGYSSPDHAMKAHVIKKRKYLGDKAERES
jgi:hypothetical protein